MPYFLDGVTYHLEDRIANFLPEFVETQDRAGFATACLLLGQTWNKQLLELMPTQAAFDKARQAGEAQSEELLNLMNGNPTYKDAVDRLCGEATDSLFERMHEYPAICNLTVGKADVWRKQREVYLLKYATQLLTASQVRRKLHSIGRNVLRAADGREGRQNRRRTDAEDMGLFAGGLGIEITLPLVLAVLELAAAKSVLTPRQYQILVLQARDGLELEGIAAAVGSTVDRVRVQRSRAKRRLKQWLALTDWQIRSLLDQEFDAESDGSRDR